MIKRFIDGMKASDRRRVFFALLGGKAIGFAILMLIMVGIPAYFGHKAFADDAPPPPAYVNPINTMWVCITAFLVFFMQAGFMFLEAGFARTRETVNVLLEGIVDTCLCGLLFWAFGFAFMFGSGNGFIGHQFFFLHGAPDTFGSTGIAMLAFFLFQYAFADTCSTITSGAMIGRCGFWGDLMYTVGVSGFIYPILGHWAWGPDGWLNTIHPAAFHDFAGSTVVHTIGGFISLAGAIVLGPRLGRKFKRDGGGPMPGHDMTIAAVGGVILWFGWYGFNPGSTLSAMDIAGHRPRRRQHDARGLRGRPVGHVLDVPAEQGVGLRHDDQRLPRRPRRHHLPLLLGVALRRDHDRRHRGSGLRARRSTSWSTSASTIRSARWPSTARGIWGTLSLGLFATGQYGAPTPTGADNSAALVVTGLFYGGGTNQLIGQAIGSGGRHRRDVRRRDGAHVPHEVHHRPPRLQGRRARGPRPARARRRRLPGAWSARRMALCFPKKPKARAARAVVSEPGHLASRFR